MADVIERFPLFPLGLVLIPHELVPLHIFEERYKLMIGECLDQDGEFGIVWLSDDGLKEVGCAARVSKVIERFDDGRLNVLVEATKPFRLLRRIDDLPYPAGDIEPLKAVVQESEDAYAIAATVDVARDAKQRLLELRSERERLEQLEAVCSEALGRIRHAERGA